MTTLLHIVSGERMQNLLPLLALRPRTVFQLCSDDEKILAAATHTESAARTAGIDADFRIHKLSGTSPTTEAVRHAHKQLISVFPGAVVNITGGTKLMSLGAYLGASEFHDSPILYCDTQNRQFIQVGKAPLPREMCTFPEVASLLTVPIVMAAQGKCPQDWQFDTATPAALEFGRSAWQLQTSSPTAFKSFGRAIRSIYRPENGKIPSGASTLQALARLDISSRLPGPLAEPVLNFLASASHAGFLTPLENGGYCLAPGPSSRDKLRSHIERISNLLVGSWLELAVLHFISSSPRHQDPRWSVEPTAPAQERAEYGETDLIAVDADRATLEIISCKTSLSQPLEHLEGLRTRANNLGGSHALATLAVLDAGNPTEQQRIRRWGKLLNVRLLIGAEIPTYFSNGGKQ